MEIRSCGRTDVGRSREHNEDFLLADPALGLYIVCDGMGGHLAGEVAAELAATTVRSVVTQTRRIVVRAGDTPENRADNLRTAIETACAKVFDEGRKDPARRGMGCTCTAVLVSGGTAVLGHVGDCRLYLERGGKVTQLSKDHTLVAEAVRQGYMTPEQGALSEAKNVLTRAIGKDRSVLVDTLVIDLAVGDTLLICSDGLHQYLRDASELAAPLSAAALEAIPPHLISLANSRGGSDNVTALVLRMEGAAGDVPGEERLTDSMRGFQALQRLELLSDLDMAEIVRFKQICQESRIEAGTAIVTEGDVTSALHVIAVGSVEVLRHGRRVALLPVGAHFGEMSLLNNRPRSATVRAIEPCRLLTVDRDRLYGLLQHDGNLAGKFFWKLASTLSYRLDDTMALHDTGSTLQKLGGPGPLKGGG